LHPTGGWKLTDERTLAVVVVAARRGAPVLVHIGKTVDVLGDINAQPTPFLDLARKFPEIPFIAGHSGFDLWKLFVEIAETVPPNVFFDVSGWQERAQGDGDNIVSDLRQLAAAFPGHVCFGTDSPFYGFNLSQPEQKWKDKMEPVLPGQWATLDSLLDYTTRNPIPTHGMIARASAEI
jgi:predicted TIM-barrel fold metal-dependent hydrolase